MNATLKVNVFGPNKNPAPLNALCNIVFKENLTKVNSASEADVIFLFGAMDLPYLYENYTDEQLFVYYSLNDDEDLAKLSRKNVIVFENEVPLSQQASAFHHLLFHMVEKKREMELEQKALVVPAVFLAKTANRYKVLVIDDKKENRDLAKVLLADHDLVVADGMKSGMEALSQSKFDAVLTDMELRPDNFYPSFSVTRVFSNP